MKFLVAAALLSLPLVAHAQTTCTTPDLSMQLSLLVDGEPITLPQSQLVFDTAECQCHSSDVHLRMLLQQAIPPSKASGVLQVWTGVGCDHPENRAVNSTLCQQLVQSSLHYSDFVEGSASSTVYLDLPIPADAVFLNNPHCSPTLQANNVYLLFAPDNDLSHAESCEFDLNENTLAPDAPAPSVTAVEEGAVTLTWTALTGVGEQVPYAYQVLCADANGNPPYQLQGVPQGYAICQNGQLKPRLSIVPSSPQTTLPTGKLTDLDPAYLCSDLILPQGPTASTLIGGLEPGQSYQFVVVAIDQSGNPTPSNVITATTVPQSGHPHGCGCDYAPTGVPSRGGLALAVVGVLVGLALGLRRRNR